MRFAYGLAAAAIALGATSLDAASARHLLTHETPLAGARIGAFNALGRGVPIHRVCYRRLPSTDPFWKFAHKKKSTAATALADVICYPLPTGKITAAPELVAAIARGHPAAFDAVMCGTQPTLVPIDAVQQRTPALSIGEVHRIDSFCAGLPTDFGTAAIGGHPTAGGRYRTLKPSGFVCTDRPPNSRGNDSDDVGPVWLEKIRAQYTRYKPAGEALVSAAGAGTAVGVATAEGGVNIVADVAAAWAVGNSAKKLAQARDRDMLRLLGQDGEIRVGEAQIKENFEAYTGSDPAVAAAYNRVRQAFRKYAAMSYDNRELKQQAADEWKKTESDFWDVLSKDKVQPQPDPGPVRDEQLSTARPVDPGVDAKGGCAAMAAQIVACQIATKIGVSCAATSLAVSGCEKDKYALIDPDQGSLCGSAVLSVGAAFLGRAALCASRKVAKPVGPEVALTCGRAYRPQSSSAPGSGCDPTIADTDGLGCPPPEPKSTAVCRPSMPIPGATGPRLPPQITLVCPGPAPVGPKLPAR